MRKLFITIYKVLNSFNKIEAFLIFLGLILSISLIIFSSIYFYSTSFSTKSKYGGFLKEGLYQNIKTLNPFLAENQSEKAIVNLIYDSLVRPNGKGNYELELAKKIIELDKGLKYEVEIKEAYWSNGERIIANDVLETFYYLKNYSYHPLKSYFQNIDLEKIDNYKIVFKLPIKDNLFFQKLSQIKIIPSKIWSKYSPNEWEKNEEELIKISSGPYFLNKKLNNYYEFVRNDYYQPLPYLEKIIFYVYPDIKETYQKLKIKEINAIGGLLPVFLENNISQNLKIEKIIMPRVIAILFNSEKVNLTEVEKFKQSINYDDLIEEVFGHNYAEMANSIFSPSIKKIFSLNFEKPSEINKSNNEYQFNIIVPNTYLTTRLGNYLQKKFGVKIENRNFSEINNNIIPQKDYQGLMYGISYNLIPDLKFLFEENSVFNLVNKPNPEIIKLIQEIEIGQEKNSLILEKLEKEINKLPIVFLANHYYPYVLPKNLENFNVKFLNDPSERFVKIEEWYFK
ncbi:MAG: ABC transporter substrate-binding protein [Patescibacteria group bacterium]|nr:ABC transporter substrate-binding protein [Patescibacteria group bacterium]